MSTVANCSGSSIRKAAHSGDYRHIGREVSSASGCRQEGGEGKLKERVGNLRSKVRERLQKSEA